MQNSRLAFCTAIKDRYNSLVITLPENIAKIPQDCCICVVDYASKSDAGERWMLNTFAEEIRLGKLIVFRVTNEIDWSSPKAKNLAHRLVHSDYMVNLDCDNFISRLDVKIFLNIAVKKIPSHQCSSQFLGTYGRIGIPSDTFYAIGGYDEGMLPMGYQDVDLLTRASSYHGGHARLSWNDSPPPIDHDKPKLFAYAKDDKFFEDINTLNMKRAMLRKEMSGIVIKDSFSSFRGRLNGRQCSIDGFGKLTPI